MSRLELLVDLAGSPANLAKLAWVPLHRLKGWMNGLPAGDFLLKGFSDALTVNFEWLRDGIGEPPMRLWPLGLGDVTTIGIGRRPKPGFAGRIRHLASLAGSLSKLASLGKVSYRQVQNWVRTDTGVAATLKVLADETGVPFDWIWFGVGPEPTQLQKRIERPRPTRATRAAWLKAFADAAGEKLRLRLDQQRALLGVEDPSLYATWLSRAGLGSPGPLDLSLAVETRLQRFLEVFREVEQFLPDPKAWFFSGNSAEPFGGRKPIEVLMSGPDEARVAVHRYMTTAMGGWM